MNTLFSRSAVTGAMVLTAGLLVSCGKKEDVVTPPAPDPNAAAAAAAPTQPAAPAPAQRAVIPPAANPTEGLSQAQTAMQAREYEKAAAALLSVQQARQPLTAEQSQAVRNQMVQLQQNLAAAIASGDPKAKAAAEMLKRSTMR